MLVTNDLTKNAKRIADDVWIVKSKKKEDALKASTQVFPGGSTVVVARPGANYVKITDGSKTFSELKTVGEGEDGPGGGVQSVTGDGVGGTASNPVLSFPTPAQIGGATAAQGAKADTAVQPAALTGYVPTSRTVNGKALSGNITLTNSDVGAAATSHTHDAAAITSGTLDAARIPTLDQSKVNNLTSDLAGKQATLSVPSQSEAESGTATTARSWTAQRDRQGIIGASRIIVSVSGSKTLVLTDEYTFQNVTAASTVTVPTNASAAIPIGAQIDFFQAGSGVITFAAAGGVTIISKGGTLATTEAGDAATLKKTSTNTWALIIAG